MKGKNTSAEWVEIIEPKSKDRMYANLLTGECVWKPPAGAKIKKTNEKQWWELIDSNTGRYYYYNAESQRTVWNKPKNCDVIPLAKLQRKIKAVVVNETMNEKCSTAVQTSSDTKDAKVNNNKSSCEDENDEDDEMQLSHFRLCHPVSGVNNLPTRFPKQAPQLRKSIINNGIILEYNKEDCTASSPVVDRKPNNNSDGGPVRMGSYDNLLLLSSSEWTAKTSSEVKKCHNDLRRKLSLHDCQRFTNSRRSPSSSFRSISYGLPFSTSQYDNVAADPTVSSSDNENCCLTTTTNTVSTVSTGEPKPNNNRRRRTRKPRTNPNYVNVEFRSRDGKFKNAYVCIKQQQQHQENKLQQIPNLTQPAAVNAVASLDRDLSKVCKCESDSCVHYQQLCHSHPSSHYYYLNDQHSVYPSTRLIANGSSSHLTENSINESESESERSQFTAGFTVFNDCSNSSLIKQKSDFTPSPRHVASVTEPNCTLTKFSCIQNDLINLTVQKKGIFGRKFLSPADILSWSAEPVGRPLIRTNDKIVKKESSEVFKLIQIYMGDRKNKNLSPSQACLELTTRGWSFAQLRNEIYMQLIKQTTKNSNSESLQRGWELLAICLSFFPPSGRLKPFLNMYIMRYSKGIYDTAEVPISIYAKVCLKRLEKASLDGPKKGLRKPTCDEIDIAKHTIHFPSMFGATLPEILALQSSRFPNRKLPWIQTTLSEEVLRLNGARTEGIFRIPGDVDEVNALKARCDQWQLPYNLEDPHVPASLLKLWYRELAEPLIPDSLYELCVRCSDNPTECLKIVEKLPSLNKSVLRYLVHFLQVFALPENVSKTKMDVNNLALVMAPNCFRCRSEEPRVIVENARREMQFLRTLILHMHAPDVIDTEET